jgi:tetratricopeptide (TPR) repeat protein
MEEQGDATDIYKQVAEVMPESAHGTVAMAASTRSGGAAALFADAVGELRDHRADTALRARLSEQAGWTWLLELGDPERADAEFLTAATADPTHPGPRLGLVLSRAKLGDPTSHAAALADLGASMNSGHVAASLLMRAAVASQVEGEPDTASRIAAAQRLSPDDGAVVTVAAEYPLQVHDFEPEVAAQLLAERAELLTTRAALAESEDDRDSWELDAADALERAGQLGRATELVVEVLRTRPDDVRAIRTLRKLCERGDDRAGYARATVSLAAVLGDGHAKIDLWREAGLVLDDELGDVRSAVPIYRRILQIDPDAGEYSRLLEIYREHGDRAGVYELLSQRLNRAQIRGKAGEQLDLLMQRAELREELGDIRGASRDLARLLTLEPRHGDALSRQSQLLVRLGQEQAAAKALELYLEVEEDAEKRGEAEIMLSQLLAESLEDFTGAIVQLEHVLLDNDDDAVRDRLITYMIRSEKWDQAIAELSKAASQRETDRERARDFLRIAEIHRRHRGNAAAAHAALERARQYDPLHIETIRELADLVGEVRDLPTRNRVLRSACRDLRAAIGEQPSRVPLYERLAVVNRWLGEPEGQFFALCAYQELRSLSPEQTAFVDEMRPLMSRAPDDIGEPMTPDEWRNRLVHPQFSGVASELWITLGRALDELRGHSPDSLGFGRGTRVSPKLIEQHHPVVANVLSAFGVAGIDVHVSADKTQTARVVGHDKPKLLLSADVAAGNNAACLFLLGRAVAQARDRTSPLYELTDADIRYYFAAAARLAGLDRLPTEVGELTAGSDEDELERYVRVLGKKLSRADRKALATAASGFSELGDPATWRHAALVSGARAGMLLCGDLQVAMDVVDIGRGGRVVVDDPDGLQLFSWTVSADHLLLRAKLGLRKTPGEGRS